MDQLRAAARRAGGEVDAPRPARPQPAQRGVAGDAGAGDAAADDEEVEGSAASAVIAAARASGESGDAMSSAPPRRQRDATPACSSASVACGSAILSARPCWRAISRARCAYAIADVAVAAIGEHRGEGDARAERRRVVVDDPLQHGFALRGVAAEQTRQPDRAAVPWRPGVDVSADRARACGRARASGGGARGRSGSSRRRGACSSPRLQKRAKCASAQPSSSRDRLLCEFLAPVEVGLALGTRRDCATGLALDERSPGEIGGVVSGVRGRDQRRREQHRGEEDATRPHEGQTLSKGHRSVNPARQ